MAPPRLFHFSEDPSIGRFEPRPVAVPSARPPGQDWLNRPLVWAVSEQRQGTYLFPRDCPRILLWPTQETTRADSDHWWGESEAAMLAFVEQDWLSVIRDVALYRYEFPSESFEPVDGDWTWVSDRVVDPVGVEPCGDMLVALAARGVELRAVESLGPLMEVWSTTLHASGIRLRHARDWSPAPR